MLVLNSACYCRQQVRPAQHSPDLAQTFGFAHCPRAFRGLLLQSKVQRCNRLYMRVPTVAFEVFETAQAAGDAVQGAFALISASSPAFLQPAVRLVGSDLSGFVSLHPTGAALGRLGVRAPTALVCN
jgi:hypothetical protein